MELILRDDIEKLGRRGEVVNVAAGYARNYLLPRGLAMAVTDTNKAQIEKEKRAWEARMAKEKEEFESLAERISELRFVAPRKVGENDLLYGPITDMLPNFDLVDVTGKPTTLIDFTVPTEGFEAPWGAAKINQYIYIWPTHVVMRDRKNRTLLLKRPIHAGRFTLGVMTPAS